MRPGAGLVVVGSANLDLVATVAAIPAPGETVLAERVEQRAGGKGLNQAVAAGRAGSPTSLIAAVGRDQAADLLLTTARAAGVDVRLVRRVDRPSGTAWVMVQHGGENAILVDSGANATLTDLSREERAAIGAAAVVLVQLEIPLPTVAEAVSVAHAGGATVVLNAAPATRVGTEVLDAVDVLVVNEHEARAMGEAVRRVPVVVVTLGANGVRVLSDGGERHVASLGAQVRDTTGAGDAFAGYLAAALAQGESLDRAVTLGAAAGALAVERPGAAASVPTRDQVDARLGDAGD